MEPPPSTTGTTGTTGSTAHADADADGTNQQQQQQMYESLYGSCGGGVGGRMRRTDTERPQDASSSLYQHHHDRQHHHHQYDSEEGRPLLSSSSSPDAACCDVNHKDTTGNENDGGRRWMRLKIHMMMMMMMRVMVVVVVLVVMIIVSTISIVAQNKNTTTSGSQTGTTAISTGTGISSIVQMIGGNTHSVEEEEEKSLRSNHKKSSTSSSFSSEVPFQHIDRQTYDDPITNFMDPSMFHDDLKHSSRNQSDQSSSPPHHSFRFPYPTGSFWTNLVLPPTADFNLSYPIVVYPYAFKWSHDKLIVSYPSLHRSILGNKAIHDYFFPDLSFGLFDTLHTYDDMARLIRDTKDPLVLQNIPTSIVDRKMIHFDPLSVTLRYYTAAAAAPVTTTRASSTNHNYWDVYLVQGSPYVTMKYHSDSLPYIKAFTTFANITCPTTITSSSSSSSSAAASSTMTKILSQWLYLDGDVTDHRTRSNHDETNSNCAVVDAPNGMTNSRHDVDVDDTASPKMDSSSDDVPLYRTLRGQQFIIETQEGVRWIMVTSETAFVTMDMHQRTLISITTPSSSSSSSSGDMTAFTGVIRYAVIPPIDAAEPDTPITPSSSLPNENVNIRATGIQRLIDHASVYPVSAKVDWKFRTRGAMDHHTNDDDDDDDMRQSVSSSDSSNTMVHRVGNMFARAFQFVFGSKSSTTTTRGRTHPPSSSDGRIGTIEFQFVTESFSTLSSTSTPELLMLALPHHLQGLDMSQQSSKTSSTNAASSTKNQLLSSTSFDLVYKSIKGPMRAIVGSQWSMDIPLLSLGFDGDSGSNDEKLYLSPSIRSRILENLQKDVKLSLPSTTEDIYGFGKQAARLAQLAHISHLYMIGQNSTQIDKEGDDGVASKVYEEATTALRTALVGLVTGKVTDRLVYDANFGGIVTTNGLTDSHADFGNGRYNDHHFHYGYLLYACAIMGKIDPTFVEEFGKYVDSIFYDIANYNNFDANDSTGAFFPGARHKIWFDGHSYASGMFPFGNGKSQESSSEAVNGYYGAYLWSLVRHGAANDPSSDTSLQTDFARLLLATEIQGAKLYWHMMPSNSSNATQDAAAVYPAEFSRNFMVGNIGMLDALCSTWFGNEELYVHMINFIPVTSATGELFSSNYIEQEYTNTLEPLGDVEMAWRGYVVADHAIIAPNTAWNEAEQLDSAMLDSALSKTQVLFWIATRYGFKATEIATPPEHSTKTPSAAKEAACSSFQVCSTLGLVGDCCPTSQGNILECCQQG